MLGFAGVILLGALLLMLPFSSSEGQWTPFTDALFTAVTSVCVTGLVVRDTGTYWSLFGHLIILLLIQIGGLGVITLGASFSVLRGKEIGLSQRSTMQEAATAPKLAGIVRFTLFILKLTFSIELAGALLLSPVFIRDFGIARGLWMSFFHSISAFCNAGIDLMGGFSSMTKYVANPWINLVLMTLIIVGGLGFLTWDDILKQKLHVKRYRMQSKVVVATTGFLILVPAAIFFFLEFADQNFSTRILASLFQSVTTRTAGFNTADLASMSEPGQMLMILLMLIGGSPGSTAGGMKTTTFAVLAACTLSVFRKRDSTQLYGRRIPREILSTATALLFMYMTLSITAAMAISFLESLPMMTCLFETGSALGTAGLTLGITPSLHTASKYILILLMYIGRVGGLTLIYATFTKNKVQLGRLPEEKIVVG